MGRACRRSANSACPTDPTARPFADRIHRPRRPTMASATEQPTTIAVQGGYELAEGGRWAGDRYVYVDILSGRLLELREDRDQAPRQLARLDVPLGAVAPVRDRPDDWIAAAGTGIALL